jgi:hypothetical protein
VSAAAALRSAVARYAAQHGMSVEGAELMPVKALIWWLEAEYWRAERERSNRGERTTTGEEATGERTERDVHV